MLLLSLMLLWLLLFVLPSSTYSHRYLYAIIIARRAFFRVTVRDQMNCTTPLYTLLSLHGHCSCKRSVSVMFHFTNTVCMTYLLRHQADEGRLKRYHVDCGDESNPSRIQCKRLKQVIAFSRHPAKMLVRWRWNRERDGTKYRCNSHDLISVR